MICSQVGDVVCAVLRDREPVRQQYLDRISGTFELQRQLLALGTGVVAQDPVGRILPPGRPAEAFPARRRFRIR